MPRSGSRATRAAARHSATSRSTASRSPTARCANATPAKCVGHERGVAGDASAFHRFERAGDAPSHVTEADRHPGRHDAGANGDGDPARSRACRAMPPSVRPPRTGLPRRRTAPARAAQGPSRPSRWARAAASAALRTLSASSSRARSIHADAGERGRRDERRTPSTRPPPVFPGFVEDRACVSRAAALQETRSQRECSFARVRPVAAARQPANRLTQRALARRMPPALEHPAGGVHPAAERGEFAWCRPGARLGELAGARIGRNLADVVDRRLLSGDDRGPASTGRPPRGRRRAIAARQNGPVNHPLARPRDERARQSTPGA